ncbi:MAG: PH domain-containing protein [Vibrionaceae bacterium]
MSSFKDKKIGGLREQEIGENAERYGFLVAEGEQVLGEYKSVRDLAVFTTKRIILIDVQGFTGKKMHSFCLSYSKITAFSCETAGTFDLDSEFRVWASGLGVIELEFLRGTDIKKVASILSKHS